MASGALVSPLSLLICGALAALRRVFHLSVRYTRRRSVAGVNCPGFDDGAIPAVGTPCGLQWFPAAKFPTKPSQVLVAITRPPVHRQLVSLTNAARHPVRGRSVLSPMITQSPPKRCRCKVEQEAPGDLNLWSCPNFLADFAPGIHLRRASEISG
jgi:hypothetical protein